MSFTLRDVPGAVVEKEKYHVGDTVIFGKFVEGYNKGIFDQSQVRLQISREKLQAVLRTVKQTGMVKEWHLGQEWIDLLADAIVAAEKEIIEVCP